MSKDSYSQIFKASSISGGSQAATLLIGMVRTKLVAILIGPSGVGLIGLYLSLAGLMSTISGFGISSSAVREIARRRSAGDDAGKAHTVMALRRIAWFTGTLGWCLTAALAWPLSVHLLGSGDQSLAVAALGAVVLFTATATSLSALLQGTQRIGDIARINVWAALIGTVFAVVIYLVLRERGVVPVLILLAIVQYLCTWWFARAVADAPVAQTWGETFKHFKALSRAGVGFMWGTVVVAARAMLIRAVIVREFGLEANGVYQAALSMATLFGGFILAAMSVDFYPRLSAVAADHPAANRTVNEQIEVGVLLALPGLVGTLAFADLLIQVFYTKAFLEGATLLPWLCVGTFMQIVLGPLAMIARAKGAARWMIVSETYANVLNVVFSVGLMTLFGLRGVAYGFALMYVAYGALMVWIARHLSGFRFTGDTIRLIAFAFTFIAAGMSLQLLPSAPYRIGTGLGLTFLATVFSLRGVAQRLGEQHRIVKLVCRLPGGRFLCGL